MTEGRPPRLEDTNVWSLKLSEFNCTTVDFDNNLYRVNSIIAACFAVDFIIRKTFINRHVEAILGTERRIRFENGSVPMVEKK